jgi:hypothetical protein
MEQTKNQLDCGIFDKDEAEFAAMVRRGFESLGGPSADTEAAIFAAAHRAAARGAAQRYWFRPRVLAAAAAAVVIAAGGLYLNLNRAAPDGGVTSSQETGFGAESTQDLAALLLDIQGLNEESFFMTEEAEPLWL